MKLLVRFLFSFCCLLLGVHAYTTQESRNDLPKNFYTLSAEDVANLQENQAYVSQRRSTGDRRVYDESAEKEEESDDDDDDDDETRSSKRHTGTGSSYITSYSSPETEGALYLSNFPSCEHLSYFSSSKFIIHCVFRI
ncbi:hypothetical protein [Niastella sp. OAS944]|uniref:hypothetical protein n=1 Tax=Niastella sp. OAS944 TaxID=2664089 RepID=UPI00348C4CA1|nr:hypothetical protein [Chitinophagaceae bacterium OAS944]